MRNKNACRKLEMTFDKIMHEWNKADLKFKWNRNEIDMKLKWNWSEDLWILIVQWIHIIKIWSVMISSRLFRSKTKIAHRTRFLTSRVFLVPLWSTTYCRTIYVFSFIYCLACSPTCDLGHEARISLYSSYWNQSSVRCHHHHCWRRQGIMVRSASGSWRESFFFLSSHMPWPLILGIIPQCWFYFPSE